MAGVLGGFDDAVVAKLTKSAGNVRARDAEFGGDHGGAHFGVGEQFDDALRQDTSLLGGALTRVAGGRGLQGQGELAIPFGDHAARLLSKTAGAVGGSNELAQFIAGCRGLCGTALPDDVQHEFTGSVQGVAYIGGLVAGDGAVQCEERCGQALFALKIDVFGYGHVVRVSPQIGQCN